MKKTNKYASLTVACILLSGCSQDKKIVDLAGIVFSVYIFLILLKYLSPNIAALPIFKQFGEWISDRSRAISFSLYVISAFVALIGYLLSGLDKILIFIAMVVAITGMHLKNFSDTNELRKRQAIDIILLSSINLIVLAMLWFYGVDLIRF